MDLYLATNGKDAWSGQWPRPNAEGTDGPLGTLQGAVRKLRALKDAGTLDGPVTVWVRGGVYPLTAPVRLTLEDSWPAAFAAWRGERPVFDGGERIAGWRVTTLNGRKAWVADLPEVAAGRWNFRSLFVNGRSAPRPRRPKQGLFRMAEAPGLTLPARWGGGGQTQFVCAAGDVEPFRNLTDADQAAFARVSEREVRVRGTELTIDVPRDPAPPPE